MTKHVYMIRHMLYVWYHRIIDRLISFAHPWTGTDLAIGGGRVNTACPPWVDTPMATAAINGNPQLSLHMERVLPFRRLAQT